jgi:hypothetical protein
MQSINVCGVGGRVESAQNRRSFCGTRGIFKYQSCNNLLMHEILKCFVKNADELE